jgi:hypothetical protein
VRQTTGGRPLDRRWLGRAGEEGFAAAGGAEGERLAVALGGPPGAGGSWNEDEFAARETAAGDTAPATLGCSGQVDMAAGYVRPNGWTLMTSGQDVPYWLPPSKMAYGRADRQFVEQALEPSDVRPDLSLDRPTQQRR